MNHLEWRFDAAVSVPDVILENQSFQSRGDTIKKGLVSSAYRYCCAEIPDGTLQSNGSTHVSIFDGNDFYLPTYSYAKYTAKKSRRRNIAVDREVAGISANLYGNIENAAGNYCHWLVDGLSRLFLIQKNVDLDEIDHFVVPVIKQQFQWESLASLGIFKDRIIEVDALECVRFETLICTTAPRGSGSSLCPGWIIDGYGNNHGYGKNAGYVKNGSLGSTQDKKIYISRQDAGSRKFVNEDDIIAMLEGYGFTPVQLSSFNYQEKIELFRSSSDVIGLTGAGLANLMFCSPGTKVVELFPSSFVHYLYASMASYRGLDYRCLIFDNESAISRANRYYGNLELDINELENIVKSESVV